MVVKYMINKSLNQTVFILVTAFEYCKTFRQRNVITFFVVVVALLFYVHGKHLRSCRDGQLT